MSLKQIERKVSKQFLHFVIIIMLIGFFFPVGIRIGEINIAIADIGIILGMMFILAYAAIRHELRLPYVFLWLSFLGISGLSVAVTNFASASVIRWVELIEMLFTFYITVNLISSQRQIRQILVWFVILACLNALLAMAQYIGLVSVGLQGNAYIGAESISRASGFIGGLFGAYLGMGLLPLAAVLFAYRSEMPLWQQIVILGLIGLLILGMLVSLTRTWMYITVLSALYVSLRFGFRKVVLAVTLTFIALYLISLLLSSDLLNSFLTEKQLAFISGRFDIGATTSFTSVTNSRLSLKWAHAFNLFQDSPLFGIGFGTARYVTSGGVVGLIDNHYLEILVEMGVFGLGIYTIITALVVWRSFKSLKPSTNREAFFITIVLQSIFFLWLLGGIFWGLLGSGKSGMMLFMLYALTVVNAQIIKQTAAEQAPKVASTNLTYMPKNGLIMQGEQP